jgi:flavin prenyltransferase
VILPPVPAFYNNPQNLDDMINHIAMRVIDQFDIHLDVMNRWDGVLLDQKRSITETE